jgi:hypothetical protein
MYFDRLDICTAYWKFAVEYHGGQFSKEYKIFGRLDKIKFSPGILPLSLSENAQEIYDNLVKNQKS